MWLPQFVVVFGIRKPPYIVSKITFAETHQIFYAFLCHFQDLDSFRQIFNANFTINDKILETHSYKTSKPKYYICATLL